MKPTVDLLIIGGGPAGVAAALQANLDGLDALLISDEPVGGLVAAAWRLHNIPGFVGGITGKKLARLLQRQIKGLGLAVHQGHVVHLEHRKTGFVARDSSDFELSASTVIVASGTAPSALDLPGFAECAAQHRGHRDVRTVPEDLSHQRVLVLGGGDAAYDSALSLEQRGAKVLIAMRSALHRASTALHRRAQSAQLAVLASTAVERLELSGQRVEAVVPGEHGVRRELVDHVVACIGRVPRDELCALAGPLVGGRLQTGVAGLFVAGDVIRGRQRYVATAFGDGQRAALLASQYLAKHSR